MDIPKILDNLKNGKEKIRVLSKQIKISVLDIISRIGKYLKRFNKEIQEILENEEDNVDTSQPQPQPADTNLPQNTFELPPEDSDEYIPQDMEMQESAGEAPHIFAISPYLPGYYTGGRKSYFDANRLIWSKKKQLTEYTLTPDTSQKKYIFSGKLRAGIISIPLPKNALPDEKSLVTNIKNCSFHIDQNNCLYIQSSGVGECAFDFYINQYELNTTPISNDKEKIIHSQLTQTTKDRLSDIQQRNLPAKQAAKVLEKYIKTSKKYDEKAQGENFHKSTKKNYFFHLDEAKTLECYSSNTLFVGLMRELGFSARLCVGHYIDSKSKKGTANIGSTTGHAWSEVWDEDTQMWIRFDATPSERENKNESQDGQSGENGESQDSGESEQNSENTEGNSGENQDQGDSSGESSPETTDEANEQSGDAQQGDSENEQNSEQGSQGGQGEGEKTAQEILDELIERVENEEYEKEREQLEEALKQLENTNTAEELNKIKEDAELTRKAKEELQEQADNKIFEKEKETLSQIDDEEELEKQLQNSLLDDAQLRLQLNEYGKKLKEKIQEEKKRLDQQMQNYGFSEEERGLFKQYLELEKELRPEIKRNIRKLEQILPKKYHMVEDETRYFSGKQIDKSKLVNYKVSGDSRVFKRRYEEQQTADVNMFETILIDRSGSMGNFSQPNSPFRNAIKAAIIRAKTLEHFKVDFNIVFFDNNVEEVMSFGEKFGDKRTKVPAKLMRATQTSGGTDISSGIIYANESLKNYAKQTKEKQLGNITFIGDGEPAGGLQGPELKKLIETTKKQFPITAFYINEGGYNRQALEGYFGDEASGGTVVVDSVSQLSNKIVHTFNRNIKKTLKRIEKMK